MTLLFLFYNGNPDIPRSSDTLELIVSLVFGVMLLKIIAFIFCNKEVGKF